MGVQLKIFTSSYISSENYLKIVHGPFVYNLQSLEFSNITSSVILKSSNFHPITHLYY